ncbi:hypothetical protein [Actinoplanes utahensis]|uniref:Uncharacterized protein n=1 Tax=Actinoplanes utahensis TaxID=1869 RepID=A0A0A6UGZ9_ACTUT|nr:hypothetical protein [Actinoplanes utahensis]KHD74348.1 hypothetical protein MB27_29190 [Actinoplanes utahensis]GIF35282.1 hypothetical protein Aut01nite_82680 [Actinoplanes utahensis]
MTNTPAPGPRTSGPIIVVALTAGWLVGTACLGFLWLMALSAALDDGSSGSGVFGRLFTPLSVVAPAFFVFAPLGIAAVARSRGLPRTAIVYLVLSAVLLGAVAVQLIAEW